MTYIRHIVHNGTLQWVLFDVDGDCIASCVDRDTLFGWTAQHKITVVTIH